MMSTSFLLSTTTHSLLSDMMGGTENIPHECIIHNFKTVFYTSSWCSLSAVLIYAVFTSSVPKVQVFMYE